MDSVRMAVHALHHPSCTPEQRREATRWLESFQNTIGAWSISLQILTEDATTATPDTSNQSTERQQLTFFAAQTLKHKLVVDYAQLEDNQVLGLRSTLWTILTTNPLPTPIKTQLCLGLAALLVQSTDYSLMHSIIQELLHSSTDAIMPINLLSLIPEQLDNKSIHMSREQYRIQKAHLIDAHTDTVMSILINRFIASSNRVHIAQCMLSWIKIGGCSDRISKDRELLRVLFGFIAVDSVIAELISELIYLASRENEQDAELPTSNGTSLDPWMQTLGECVRDMLIPLINTHIGDDTPDNRLESEEDKEMRAYMSILADAGEYHMERLFPRGHLTLAGQSVLQGLLLITTFRSFAVFEISLPFWEALASLLHASSGEGAREAMSPAFGQLFRLIVTLYLPFPEERLGRSEEAQFREFRHVVGDCLKDCVRVLGSTQALQIILESLSRVSIAAPSSSASSLSRSSTPLGGNISENTLEGILFALRVIGSTVDRRESEILPTLLPSLIHTPNTSPRIRYAVTLILGCYADWYASNATMIDTNLISFIATGFATSPECASASALAVKWLGEACSTKLIAFMDQLLNMYTGVIQGMPVEDATELLSGMSMIVNAIPSKDTQDNAMNVLALYPLALLQVNPLQALKLLSVIIEGCPSKGEDSVTHQLIVSKLLPTMSSLLEQQPMNVADQLAEPMTELLRSILLGLFDDAVGGNKHYIHVVIQSILPVCSAMLSRGIASACYVLRTIIIHTNSYQSLMGVLRQASCMPMPITDDYLAMMTACMDYCEDRLPVELVQNGMNVATSTLSRQDATESEQRQAIMFMSHCGGKQLNHELLVDSLINRLPLSLMTDVAHLLCRVAVEEALEFFKVLLSRIPASLFTDSEKGRLWEDAGRAVRESKARVRDVREVLGRVKEACERRSR